MTDPIRAAGSPLNPVSGFAGPPVPNPTPPPAGAPEDHAGAQAQSAAAPVIQPGRSEPAASAHVQLAMEQVRDFLKSLPPELQFSEDKDSGHTVFKVVNPVTGEVIRQFPPEEILAMSRKLKQLEKQTTGALYDKKL